MPQTGFRNWLALNHWIILLGNEYAINNNNNIDNNSFVVTNRYQYLIREKKYLMFYLKRMCRSLEQFGISRCVYMVMGVVMGVVTMIGTVS